MVDGVVDALVASVYVVTAAVLLIAGPGKFAAPHGLATTLTALAPPRTSPGLARGLAQVVGLLETLGAVLLATTARSQPASVVLIAVGAGIVAVSGLAITRGLTVPCGCFAAVDGTGRRSLGWRTLGFGAAFVVVAGLCVAAPPTGPADLRLSASLTLALGFVLATHRAQLRPLFLRGFGRGQ